MIYIMGIDVYCLELDVDTPLPPHARLRALRAAAQVTHLNPLTFSVRSFIDVASLST